jgi:hypothetical protein
VKGDKVVAFCDRQCNVIAPLVVAPGNRNEAPLLREVVPEVMRTVRKLGMDLRGTILSLDGVYDCRDNRKAIFNRDMVPNINPNPRGRKQPKRGRKPIFEPAISRSASGRSSLCLPERTSSADYCCGSNASAGCTTRSRPSPTR